MIDVYVTHYVNDDLIAYNDLLIDTLKCLHGVSPVAGGYALHVIYSTDSDKCEAELRQRVPYFAQTMTRVESRVQPVLMNMATELAKKKGSTYFVCLHNDVRPGYGWLDALVRDLRLTEKRYGRGNVVMSPRYIPYHFIEQSARAGEHPAFWEGIRPPRESKILSVEAMAAWCEKNGFEFDGTAVTCPTGLSPTDDGHQLMMYAAAPEFFDSIGGCDESFVGLNYGDCDWGIRALKAGKKNMTSQSCLMQHISGITFFNPKVRDSYDTNENRFIAKWGRPTWDAMQNGSIWVQLHQAQRARENPLLP